MTTSAHHSPGTLLAVPIAKTRWALIKVLYRSKHSGGLYCVGMAPAALDSPTRPSLLPSSGEWRHLDSDLGWSERGEGWVQLVDDRVLDAWEDIMGLGPLVTLGHDPTPIPRESRLRCLGQSVYDVDEYVGPKKEGDGVKDMVGALVLPFMWALQRMLGVPQLGPAPKRLDAGGRPIPMGDERFLSSLVRANIAATCRYVERADAELLQAIVRDAPTSLPRARRFDRVSWVSELEVHRLVATWAWPRLDSILAGPLLG